MSQITKIEQYPIAGLDLSQPQIMGIVNVTPDSFSDGGDFFDPQYAVDHALRLEDEGADILDIGGESTRPGSEPVPQDEELKRVLPVIEKLKLRVQIKLSIDTRKAKVMKEAAAAGADIINDVSALTYDHKSILTAVELQLPVVLMHAQGDPKTMQHDPTYENVVADVYNFLKTRIDACVAAGLPRNKIIIDPGIGFGKNLDHNLSLLSNLNDFKSLKAPILLGVSRKSFIAALTNEKDTKNRLPGSLAAALCGIQQGVSILRVHDVAETRQALTVWQACYDHSKS